MGVIKQCERCLCKFTVKAYRASVARFCSKQCNDLYKRVDKICEQCGKLYTVKRSHSKDSRFCGRKCQGEWRSATLVGRNAPNYRAGGWTESDAIKCRICNMEFEQLRAYLKKGFGDICSKDCRAKARGAFKGIKSPRYVERVEVKCEWCGSVKQLIPSFAKTFRFCSKDCRNDWQSKVRMRGANHPKWDGGKSDARVQLMASREYKEWRRKVFERDRYTCQKCGDSRGGNLHAHHLKLFSIHPELALDVDNGLTVCKDCHEAIHSKVAA